jgi:predicted nuclease of predicted toxin-antitoxin system
MLDENNKRKFLLDENLPKSLLRALRAAGYPAARVIDEGLRGKPDSAIFRRARSRFVIITRDKDYLKVEQLPAPHLGIIVVNLSNNTPVAEVVSKVMSAVSVLEERDLANMIYVVEPDQVHLLS